MEPTSIIAIITAAIPFITAAAKKLLKTDQWGNRKKGYNALIPVIIGIVSSGLYARSQGFDWITSIAIGLGSGGAASSVRDIDRNLLQVANAILLIFKNQNKKDPT